MDSPAATAATADKAPGDKMSLGAAVAALLGDVRGLLSDAADIVAADSQVALRRAVVVVVSALGAALLGGLGIVAILVAITAELVSRGLSLAAALVCVAALCGVTGVLLWSIVARVSRQASFASTRRLLRGSI
ncbi:MAG: phage holin family protein [Casimicrobiaceae bacterium]